MLMYLTRRLAGAIPRLLLISLVLFLLVHLPSGGPADIYAADPSASPGDIERLREIWGLNQPLHVQYVQWVGNVVTGSWGRSFSERRAARTVVSERILNTLYLTGGALLFALVVGIPLGIFGATSRWAINRYLFQAISVTGISVPTFWSGTLVILVFSVHLRWIPSGGMGASGTPSSVGDLLVHLAAPAIVLGSVYVAQWSRYVHAGLTEALKADYVRTARAKGASSRAVVIRHALPNIAIPFVTVLGLEVPRMLSGAMVTEVVFAWPGLGRLITDSLLARDYPVVLGVLMVFAGAVVFANLVTDLLYGWLDPRIRYD